MKAADVRLVREEKLKEIEELLSKAVDLASQSGISQEEVLEILNIYYSE